MCAFCIAEHTDIYPNTYVHSVPLFQESAGVKHIYSGDTFFFCIREKNSFVSGRNRNNVFFLAIQIRTKK